MANVTFPATTDGDAIVKQYSSITINSGDTVTVDNKCKGLILYCTGNCTINGTLSMDEKGAAMNAPTPGGAISPNGLRWVWYAPGSTGGPLSQPDVPLAVLGPAAAAMDNPAAYNEPEITTVQSIVTGGTGGNNASGNSGGWPARSERDGGDGPGEGATGGGGGGTGFAGGGTGGAGYAWCGGGGGGGAGAGGYDIAGESAPPTNTTGGGNGGSGPEGGRVGGGGGAGSPAGEGAPDPDGNGLDGGGAGGLICLFVQGNIDIGPTGAIKARGGEGGNAAPPGAGSNGGGGGGAGGGRIIICHGGTYTNNGTVSVDGGTGGGGGPTPASAPNPNRAGNGGAGAITVVPVGVQKPI